MLTCERQPLPPWNVIIVGGWRQLSNWTRARCRASLEPLIGPEAQSSTDEALVSNPFLRSISLWCRQKSCAQEALIILCGYPAHTSYKRQRFAADTMREVPANTPQALFETCLPHTCLCFKHVCASKVFSDSFRITDVADPSCKEETRSRTCLQAVDFMMSFQRHRGFGIQFCMKTNWHAKLDFHARCGEKREYTAVHLSLKNGYGTGDLTGLDSRLTGVLTVKVARKAKCFHFQS